MPRTWRGKGRLRNMDTNKILEGFISEQLDFYERFPGRLWLAVKESSEYEFCTEEIHMYLDGIYDHELGYDDLDPWEKAAKEQEEYGVKRVVLLDYYGEVLYETD